MIKVNKIEPQTVRTYGPQRQFLGKLNEYEFNDLQAQIVEQSAEGYYFVFDNEEIKINSNGECERWPKGFFDTTQNCFIRMLKARKKKREENGETSK